MNLNTALIIILFGAVSAAIYDMAKTDMKLNTNMMKSLDAAYEISDSKCIEDLKNGKQDSEACKLSDDISLHISGVKKWC